MIHFTATGRRATARTTEHLTTGSVGIPVTVKLSSDFDGLSSTLVLKNGDAQADVPIMGQDITLPTEVLSVVGKPLMAGVYGALPDGTIVIPTVWATVGTVREGAEPSGVDPSEPTPSWAAQVQRWAEDAAGSASAASETAEGIREDMDAFNVKSAEVLADARAATTAASDAASSASQAESDLRAAAERGDFDGISPTVEIASTETEHTVTVADRDGEHSYTVPTYADEEAARVAAESARASAEGSRVTAESERAAAETGRESTEDARAQAEADRANAESLRVAAEQSRVTAESARASAETDREQAWDTLSADAESATKSATQAAQAASQAAGEATDAATTASQTAESVAQAEAERVTAESARAAAEQSRVTAEESRASEWAGVKSDAEAATTAASEAAESANDAAEDATEAAGMARRASSATWLSGNVPVGELAEGTILTTDDAYAAPPMGMDVYGVSTQDGTPTPDAPVEIQSVVNPVVTFAGANLLDSPHDYDVTTYGMTWHFDELGRFHAVSGTASSTRTVVLYAFKEPLRLPAGDYYFTFDTPKRSGDAETKGPGIRVLHADGTRASTIENFSTKQESPVLLTLVEGDAIVAITFAQNSGTAYSPNNIYSPRLWPATFEDKGYEPYAGHTIPNLLPEGTSLRSLPDGTRDELRLTYQGPSDTDGCGTYGVELVQRVGSTTTAATDGITGTVGVDVLSTTGEIADGATVTYPLATPTTHDLGTVELPVLPSPELTVWANGGSAQPTIDLTYERDVNIVIASLKSATSDALSGIAPVEQSPATTNHAVGDLIAYDGSLYKVTKAIATGEKITIGTNVAATTVAEQLQALA